MVIDEHFLTTLTRKAIDHCLVERVRACTMEATLPRILGELLPPQWGWSVGVFAKETIVEKNCCDYGPGENYS